MLVKRTLQSIEAHPLYIDFSRTLPGAVDRITSSGSFMHAEAPKAGSLYTHARMQYHCKQ